MRLKLLRRRLSISAPRMIVRSRLPWPLRWVAAALILGFSAALGLWAFEFGKDIAGLDRRARAEVVSLRGDLARLASEHDRALSIANTAESLLKSEKVAQERLAAQIRDIEAENLELKADLAFFERLLPVAAEPGANVRALQVSAQAPGLIRYQLLVVQSGRAPQAGLRYEFILSGTLAGKAWTAPGSNAAKPVPAKQYLRAEGVLEHPAAAVVKSVQVRLLDAQGAVRATQTAALDAPPAGG